MVPGLRNKQAKHCMWKAFVYLASYICFWKCVSLTNLGYTTETVFTLNKVHTSTKKNTTLFAQGKNKMTLKKNKIIKCQVLVSGFRFLKEIGYNYLWSHAVENWKKRTIKYREQQGGTSIWRGPRYKRTSLCNPVIVKYMEKYLDTTERRYSEQILQVPWHSVISRFQCTVN